jgi:hypothetical protein
MPTEEQKQCIEKFREEYLSVGLDTTRADKTAAEEAIHGLYKFAERELAEEAPFIWVESPAAACGLITIMEKHTEEGVALLEAHRDSKNNRDVVPTKTINELMEKLKLKMSYHRTNFWGQQESYWVAFYQCGKALGAKYETSDDEKLQLWDQLCRATNWWWAFSNRVVLSEKPVEIHREGEVLHRDGGKAVLYSDGWGTYSLNGIRVPARFAETPAEQLDPKEFSRITNAEIRREFVRKVGIERIFWAHESKLIDGPTERNDSIYELHLLNIGTENPREFLKMQNASRHLHGHLADVWHIEGVPPGTRTVEEALAFRNGRSDAPSQLT